MKTRSGFVSNSSSTSFTCDVCGTSEAGYDMCLSDCGMCNCRNGHTFCEDHQKGSVPEATEEEKRQALIESVQESTWMKDDEKAKEIEEIKNYDEDTLESNYEDLVSDSGIDPKYCPICQFDVSKPDDMLEYALITLGMTEEKLLGRAKDSFRSYKEFLAFVKPAKEK